MAFILPQPISKMAQLVVSVIVSLLLAIAIHKQFELHLHELSDREYNIIPGVWPIPIHALIKGLEGKTQQKPHHRNLRFTESGELDLAVLVNSASDHIVDLLPFLSPDSKKAITQSDLQSAVTIVSHPSWNVQLYTIVCQLHAALQKGAPACRGGTTLEAYTEFIRDGLSPGANRIRDLGYIRGTVSSLAWRQTSQAVLEQGFYRTTSATLLPQWMCTGDDTHWSTEHRSSWNVHEGLNYNSLGAAAAISAAKWSNRVSKDLLPAVLSIASQPSPRLPSEQVSLDRTLLQKVHIWRPLSSPLSNQALLQAVFRPAVACVSVTTRSGLIMALLQHRLWGYQCDDFVILFSTPNGVRGESISYTAEEEAAIVASGMLRHHIAPLEVVYNYTNVPQVNLAWQRMVEASEWLEYWSENHRFSHYYFVNEEVFAIPENLYSMLSKPEYYGLNAAGKPLYLGNRMVVNVDYYDPGTDTNTQRRVSFIHTGPGFIINEPTRKLLYLSLHSGHCSDNILTSNFDLLLAECLGLRVNVRAMDTADELGEDRFHPLSLSELIDQVFTNTPTTTTENSWYAEYKPKSQSPIYRKDPLRLLSGTSIGFGRINTPEKAIWMFKTLRQ